jgi:hypothetical protein
MSSKIKEHFRKHADSYIMPLFMAAIIGGFTYLLKYTDKAETKSISNIINKVEMHDGQKGISIVDREYFLSAFDNDISWFYTHESVKEYFNSIRYVCVINDTIPKVVIKEKFDALEGKVWGYGDLLKGIDNSLK